MPVTSTFLANSGSGSGGNWGVNRGGAVREGRVPGLPALGVVEFTPGRAAIVVLAWVGVRLLVVVVFLATVVLVLVVPGRTTTVVLRLAEGFTTIVVREREVEGALVTPVAVLLAAD